ncbi:MAG: DUF4430 domain-containing protein [Synergistaceae bacterium]|jgi:hypothetical protein|nr:DUF4430 domain-containing protein [Synergistaceae bacterium]
MKKNVKRVKAVKISRLIAVMFLALLAAALTLVPANAAQVAVTVEKLTVDGGFLVEPVLYTLPDGKTTAAQATVNLLSSRGLTVNYAGGPTSAYFYINNIAGLRDDGMNGWMITVNNTFIKTSGGVHTLNNGAVMRWQYSREWGLDLGTDIWDWDFSTDPVPSTKPSRDALIWKIAEINAAGNKSSYGSAYTSAMAVLSRLNSTAAEITAALTALNASTPVDPVTPDTPNTPNTPDTPNTPNTPDTPGENPVTPDDGATPGDDTDADSDADSGSDSDSGSGSDTGAAAEIIGAPAFIPPSGTEAGSGTRAVQASVLEALGYGNSVTTNAAGAVTFSESAFISGLNGSADASIDTEKPITPLPVFRTGVTENGTAVVTLSVRLDRYDGETLGAIAVLKMKRNGTAGALDMVTSSEKLTSGAYVWTDGFGNAKRSSEKAVAGQHYFMSVAIEDDSQYDLDRTTGTIIDPLALAVTKEVNNSNSNGEKNISDQSGGGGGCDAGGGFGLAALAICSLALRKKRI